MGQASLSELTARVIAFRDERDWKQFHNPKDVALSLSLEAAELLEIFQWKGPEAANASKSKVEEELADLLYWVLLMAHDLDIDLPAAFDRKLSQNSKKYPVGKAKGKSTKYSEL